MIICFCNVTYIIFKRSSTFFLTSFACTMSHATFPIYHRVWLASPRFARSFHGRPSACVCAGMNVRPLCRRQDFQRGLDGFRIPKMPRSYIHARAELNHCRSPSEIAHHTLNASYPHHAWGGVLTLPTKKSANVLLMSKRSPLCDVDRRIYWRFSPRVLRGADQFKVCTDTQSRFAAHFHQRMVADSGSHAPGCHLPHSVETSCAKCT